MRVIIRTLFLCLCLALTVSANAQKKKNVHGIATMYVSQDDNMSFAAVKEECIRRAKYEAIKEAFGEMITSTTNMVDAELNGETLSQFFEETNLTSKAEWIEHTKDPKVSWSPIDDGRFVCTAEVWGKAREIKQSKIEFDWKILCGGTSAKYENNSFNNKERIYIMFKTPAAGYVAIYLLDSTNKLASCLLPYKNNQTGRHKVMANKQYVFFDKNSDSKAVGYNLTTNAPLELDQVVFIFSPNPFTKCIDITGDRRHPNSLGIDDFEKWLNRIRDADSDMVVDRSKWVKIINSKA